MRTRFHARFRPRGSLAAFFKQYYRYARGDGKADLWRRRHFVRYVTYLAALPTLLALTIWHSPFWVLALGSGAATYLCGPYRRLMPDLRDRPPVERVQAMVFVPLIRLVGDAAKMAGYPVGVLWRFQRRREQAIHWREKIAAAVAARR